MSFNLSLVRFLVQCNFTSIVSIVLLLSLILTNVTFSKSRNRKFFILCATTFFLTICDNIRFITFHLNEPNIWRYLSAAGGYSLRPIVLFLFAFIIDENKSKKILLICIPLIVNTLLAFLSCIPAFHGLMFSYSPDNQYIRGIFGYFPYIVSALYIFLIISDFIHRKYINIIETLIVFFIIFLGIIATFLESAFKFDLILSQEMIIGSIFYYVFLNIQLYKRDSLTNLENRRCFYLQLEKIKNNDFIFISMDLNNLKAINDSKGHAAGDEAIVTCVNYMHKYFSKPGTVYRTGGDEFMCIIKNIMIDEINIKIKAFQEELQGKKLQVACGVAVYHPGDNFDKIISLADEAMYENKKLLKNSNN